MSQQRNPEKVAQREKTRTELFEARQLALSKVSSKHARSGKNTIIRHRRKTQRVQAEGAVAIRIHCGAPLVPDMHVWNADEVKAAPPMVSTDWRDGAWMDIMLHEERDLRISGLMA